MSASPRKQEDTRKPGQIVNWKWEKRKWRDVFKTIMRPQNGKPVARKSYCNHFFWWFTLNFKGVHGQIIHGILLGTLFAAFCLPGIDWIGLDYPAGRYNTKFHSHLGVKGRELEKPMIVLAFGRADFEFNGANTFFSHFVPGPIVSRCNNCRGRRRCRTTLAACILMLPMSWQRLSSATK